MLIAKSMRTQGTLSSFIHAAITPVHSTLNLFFCTRDPFHPISTITHVQARTWGSSLSTTGAAYTITRFKPISVSCLPSWWTTSNIQMRR